MIESKPLTPSQIEAVRDAARSRRSLSDVQCDLHHALTAAQTGREREWAGRVSQELADAREAIREHHQEVTGPDGLYPEILGDAPHLQHQVERLQRHLAQVEDHAGRIAGLVERARAGDSAGLETVRPEMERTLATLRLVMAGENDLVFERFRDLSSVD